MSCVIAFSLEKYLTTKSIPKPTLIFDVCLVRGARSGRKEKKRDIISPKGAERAPLMLNRKEAKNGSIKILREGLLESIKLITVFHYQFSNDR